jgi:hypothetical protein
MIGRKSDDLQLSREAVIEGSSVPRKFSKGIEADGQHLRCQRASACEVKVTIDLWNEALSTQITEAVLRSGLTPATATSGTY